VKYSDAELFDAFVLELPKIWSRRIRKRGISEFEEVEKIIDKWYKSGGFAGDLKRFKDGTLA
jgi:hypothetical protein